MSSHLFRSAAAAAVALLLGHGAAQALDSADDWSRVGAVARSGGLPVVVVVTGEGCGHCERMRQDLFSGPGSLTLLGDRAVTREFSRDTGGKVTDFDGDRVRSRVFLSRYGVFATPTVLFLDPDGQPLAQPLVGYNERDAYRELLSDRLEQALGVLAAQDDRAGSALANAGPALKH